MKWFQHMTDAHDDEFVKELMHKFGSDGYTAWFVTAELVAKIVKVLPAVLQPGKPAPKVPYKVHARFEAVPHVFIDATKIPPDRLEKVYEYCTRRRKFRFMRTKERWVINWPKILEFKDNTTADLIAKYLKVLGSSLEAPSEGGALPPLKGIGDKGIEGGGGGEGPSKDELALWFRRIMPSWEAMCPSPGEKTKRANFKDWIRQGVSRRAIEEAPMLPQYQTMDFFVIGRELKKGVNGHGHNGNGTHRSPGGNAGAREVLRTFALGPGELEAEAEKRIRDRERGEAPQGAATGGDPAQDPGNGAPPAV